VRSLTSRIGIIALALAASGGSCAEERPTTIEDVDLPRPTLRLIVLTDLDGYLEPCGCTSRPLGGIDRMAAAVRELRSDRVPTVFVAAGNVFLHGAPHGIDVERATAQEVWKAETIVEVLDGLELAAATPGPLDFSFGTEAFMGLARAADFPMLGAGVTLGDAFEGHRMIEAGDLTVGIVGQTDLHDTAGRLPDGVEQRDAIGDALRAVHRADLVVALVTGDRRAARRMAARDGVDFVVHGGLDAQDPQPPSSGEGEAVILQGGRHGRGLVVVDLVRRGDGSWTDVSAWTRRERREQLDTQIEGLRAQIAEWEREGANERDVARQRTRLARLEAQAASLASVNATGNVLDARFHELPEDAPRDAAVGRLLDRYDRRVNSHNQRSFADWAPEPAAEGRPHYVGSDTCASCHGAAVAWWRTTAHGNAYATLEEQHKNFNLSCVGCHVTGYLRPGGSTVTHVENLTNVGCENCHGPGSMHVADPEGAAVNVVRDPPEATCIGCHNPEHSDRFDFTIYRRMMIAPGHGEPAR
jgi:hypothetical protein